MKLFITAKPRAYETRVEKLDDAHFVVSVTEPPIEGRANRAIIAALADYFKCALSSVRIISGHTSRQKIVEVVGCEAPPHM